VEGSSSAHEGGETSLMCECANCEGGEPSWEGKGSVVVSSILPQGQNRGDKRRWEER